MFVVYKAFSSMWEIIKPYIWFFLKEKQTQKKFQIFYQSHELTLFGKMLIFDDVKMS